MSSILQLGIIQTACSADVKANLTKSAEYTIKAAKAGAQIICHQEMHNTLYFCQGQDYEQFKLAETIPGPTSELYSKIAKEYKVVIIVPIFEKRMDGVYHNTVIVIDADGSIADIYRKMHIPQDPGFDEKFYFTPGDLGFKAIKTKYATIGTLICWDQWYPEAARITALKGAQILFYPTAIGWDSKESPEIQNGQLEAWQTIQRSHAIANGCFVCSVNRVGTEEDLKFWGNSFVADPLGRVLTSTDAESEQFRIQTIDLAQIDDTRTHWPFFRDRRIDAYSDILKRVAD